MNSRQRRVKRRARDRMLRAWDERSLAAALKYRTYVPAPAASEYGWEPLLLKEGYELDGLKWTYPTPTVPLPWWRNHYADIGEWGRWRSFWTFTEMWLGFTNTHYVINGDTSYTVGVDLAFGH